MINNLKEAKALVVKYRSIKAEDLERYMINGKLRLDSQSALEALTGFGSNTSCTLCSTQERDEIDASGVICDGCIYKETTGRSCQRGENNDTYFDIEYASGEKGLLLAYKNRANHLENLIKQVEK